MADLCRRGPQPPPGPPRVEHTPGLAEQMLRELAPLLAAEGIDVDNIDTADPSALRAAMNRAVERRNMELFSPVGAARDIALTTLRSVIEAVLGGDTMRAAALLDQVQPDSPDNTVATVAGCIGIGLGRLDERLGGQDRNASAGLTHHIALPTGHWNGERAATDILVLARKHRALAALDKLLTRHGGDQVLAGSALALAAVIDTQARHTNTTPAELIKIVIR